MGIRQIPELKRIDPDVICSNTMVIPWGAILATLANRPHLWMVEELGQKDHNLKFYFPFSKVIDFITCFSNQITTNSKAVQQELLTRQI